MSKPVQLSMLIASVLMLSSCGSNLEVSLWVSENTVKVGDTIHTTVESKNIHSLIVDFGDSTEVSLVDNIPAQSHFKHAYDSADTYYLRVVGFSDKHAESDMETIEVQ